VLQRSNDLLALAMRRGVRMVDVGASTIEQIVGVSTIARNVGVSTIAQNVGAPTIVLAGRKQFPPRKIDFGFRLTKNSCST
jgi:hypothetical protein